MLRRLLGNIAPTIDKWIERIPPHIRDIIQKASIAFAALIALLVIISGINKGLREAQPAGYRLVERNRDVFYLQEMREEYAKKRKLVEDVEVDPLQFPSRQQVSDESRFVTMGRDTMGHLMGEKDEMLKSEDPLRPKEKSPGYLGDSYVIPRIVPDKKTIDDEDHLLTIEKIGSRAREEGSNNKAPSKTQGGIDIFDSVDAKPVTRPSPGVKEKSPQEPSAVGMPKKQSNQLEFME